MSRPFRSLRSGGRGALPATLALAIQRFAADGWLETVTSAAELNPLLQNLRTDLLATGATADQVRLCADALLLACFKSPDLSTELAWEARNAILEVFQNYSGHQDLEWVREYEPDYQAYRQAFFSNIRQALRAWRRT